MSARIRLARTGRRNFPSFRIGVFDEHSRRDGAAIEVLGSYDPKAKDNDKKVTLNDDRAKYWLSVGAQPTDTVRSILRRKKLL